MKKLNKITFMFSLVVLCSSAFAGNEDRAGEAGAPEILVNPWARSGGFGAANSTAIRGIEAISLNVGGLAQVDGTELAFTHTNYLGGSGITINAFGLAQPVGETGVIGLSVSAMNLGDNDITTVESPEGGLGTFSPVFLNIGVSYAKTFSNSIYGGLTVKLISESEANATTSGIALDAGVKYVTGKYDQIQFGITLRNVGPPMKFSGNGLAVSTALEGDDFNRTLNSRAADFELPSQIMIGISYDFFLSGTDTINDKLSSTHRLTAAGNFTSNSFTRDQFSIGAEYAFREMFMFRGAFVYEEETLDENLSRTATVGPAMGASVAIPMGQSGTKLALDYSYRATRTFGGTHSIGLRLNL